MTEKLKESTKCDNCIHYDVCKHKELYTQITEKIKNQFSEIPSCFYVNFICREYNNKNYVSLTR